MAFMDEVFRRQFWTLFLKNWVVLSKHPYLNLLRCFVMPVAYGIFLAVAQLFLTKPNNFGIGQPVPVHALKDQIDGSLALFWADGTNGTGFPAPMDIMSRVTNGFSSSQLRVVHQLPSPNDIANACPQNFNLFSECFAAVAFNSMPMNSSDISPLNYTIMADGGLFHIDVKRHSSDYELRILPLQWAIDSAIIELKTGKQLPTPLEWPFTQESNTEQFTRIRLSYVRGLRQLLVLALFICFIGIAYQLPGSFMGERANLLTSHMKAMGLRDSARILSWHISISLAYLPAWIIVSLVWHFRIFTATHVVIVLFVHLLFGLSLASWSLFVGAPFGSSPQLAAVASTFLSLLFAILAQTFGRASTGAAFIYSIIFPSGFYIFAIRAIAGFENNRIHTNVLKGDPDNHLSLLPLMIAALIDIFLWPVLAVIIERKLYDARGPGKATRTWWNFGRHAKKAHDDSRSSAIPQDTAISIRNLNVTFSSPWWKWKKESVTAIADLSLDIPKHGIFVLLGSNGAGKSTTLSILSGLLGRTSGSVVYEDGRSLPSHGILGIVPQKNVLFPELSCYQTLKVWHAIKRPKGSEGDEDIVQLLKDCDLEYKIHSNASTLSGGQKRKLQLAIGLVGGSKIVLVDEATSGVDPLSRRSLWRTLTAVRTDRTIVFTTHFLDEADLLADNIAILAAPGKLVAEGPPVTLKSSLGEGYMIQILLDPIQSSEKPRSGAPPEILDRIRAEAPEAYSSSFAETYALYHLKSKDPIVVGKILNTLERDRLALGITSYDVHGTTIEDIFLKLMKENGQGLTEPKQSSLVDKHTSLDSKEDSEINLGSARILRLANGRIRSPLSQALTIFNKRCMIARRAWLTPLLSFIIAVAGSCVPLFFLNGRAETCVKAFDPSPVQPLYYPFSPLLLGMSTPDHGNAILTSPSNITQTIGLTSANLHIQNIQDNATFFNDIAQNFQNLSQGGISVDLNTGDSLVAWEATPPGLTGPTMLNLATNILYNNALNSSGQNGVNASILLANFQAFPAIDGGTLFALKWTAFFGACMAAYPAFYALYVSSERRTSVQAMQLSNGLADPSGLWIGHLLFDGMFSTAASAVIIIVFATVTDQFHGLGLFWVVLFLYGLAGALFAYCVSLVTNSPLAAFALVAGYQIVMFIVYVAGYLLTLTYAKTSQAGKIITILNFTLSLLSPVASPLRASFISVNLFSLLCDGETDLSTRAIGVITKFGGPITYLIVYILVLFTLLVWFDSGSKLPRKLIKLADRKDRRRFTEERASTFPTDVDNELEVVVDSNDPLRVMHVTKSFPGMSATAVDDVSFGVPQDTILALLGPNGAGKTSTFRIIQGDIIPDLGDVLIQGVSVVRHPRTARLSLGVCPQFTAIDSQLTVREHLHIYGRLKGLYRGPELEESVDILLQSTALDLYADRLASQLSGGNQRKLSLAIALIGNPSVVLIDEFSTGIDAKMKRDMWSTLKSVAIGKAVVITTHSMEEASALATKVGIIARKLLAVGPTQSLAARFPIYEVHFSCRTREEVKKAQELMARIPGSRMSDDVATRFEVPLHENRSLADLFKTLVEFGDFSEYTVERVSLESVFLKVIRENNIKEEDFGRNSNSKRSRLCCL